MKEESYEVYKGLQKPLVFKGYKGRFIYWMAGGLFVSFILCVILCISIGYLYGGIALVVGASTTVFFVNLKQKEGVHSKKKDVGVYQLIPIHSINRNNKNN